MNVRDVENLKEKRMNGSLWMLRKMKNTPGKQSHFIEGQTNDKGSIDGDRFQQVAFRQAYAGRIYDVEFAGKDPIRKWFFGTLTLTSSRSEGKETHKISCQSRDQSRVKVGGELARATTSLSPSRSGLDLEAEGATLSTPEGDLP